MAAKRSNRQTESIQRYTASFVHKEYICGFYLQHLQQIFRCLCGCAFRSVANKMTFLSCEAYISECSFCQLRVWMYNPEFVELYYLCLSKRRKFNYGESAKILPGG